MRFRLVVLSLSLGVVGCGSATNSASEDAGPPADAAFNLGSEDARPAAADAPAAGGFDVPASNGPDRAPGTDVASGDGGGGDVRLPAIDPATDFLALTDAQQRALCDWRDEQLGGYGQRFPCGGGTILTDEDQTACVQALFTSSCRVTVGQFEQCVLALAPTHGCNPQRQICAPVYTCYEDRHPG